MSIDTLCQLKQVWRGSFADPEEAIESFFRYGYSPNRCRYLEVDGRIVSALYWFDCLWEEKPLAYLYAVGTLPQHRGNGYAAQLIRSTHEVLKAAGYYGAVLKPAEGLFPYYERLGYTTCGWVDKPLITACGDASAIKELDADVYAALRRQYLPHGGVVQEGDVLVFLQQYARFYEGPGCVLCAGREEKAVFEFLGDIRVLPGVLQALQIPCATPITPGASTPFLMYCPFTPKSEAFPKYLGLSLE